MALGLTNNPQVTQFIVMVSNVDPLLVLLNYGGLGLGLLLFISGKLHTGTEIASLKEQYQSTIEDLQEQRDLMLEMNTEMRRQLLGQTIPTLGRMTTVLEATTRADGPSTEDLLRQVLSELRERKDRSGDDGSSG